MSANELQIKTNALAGSRLAVEITIPKQRCQKTYEEALARLSRSVKLPGFRQGKVPRAVILQQIGVLRIRASALETLLDKSWKEALKEKNIEALSEPEVKDGFDGLLNKFDPNESLIFTLETDIAPTPHLKAAKGLTAEIEPIKFDPKKVDELIEQSRKQMATLVPADSRPAAMGDIAVVDFKGVFDNGEEIEGGSGDSMDIELEKGKMIPGFIEGIIGMSLNDQKELKCQFPKDYPDEKARGKNAIFSIKLKELKVRELPELNDEFAKQASDKSTMNELRKDLENRLKEDAERRDKTNKQEALVNILSEQLEVELPKSLVDREVMILVEQTARRFAQQGMDVKSMFTPELVKSLMDSSQEEAKDSLRKKLSLQALAKQENIEIDDQEFEAKLNEVQKELESEKNIDQQKLRDAVKEDLLEEKLIQWLEENNTIIEKNKKAPKTKTKKESSEKIKSPKDKV